MTASTSHRRITPQTPHTDRPTVSPPSPLIMAASPDNHKNNYIPHHNHRDARRLRNCGFWLSGRWLVPCGCLEFLLGLKWRGFGHISLMRLWTPLLAVVSGCFSSLFLFFLIVVFFYLSLFLILVIVHYGYSLFYTYRRRTNSRKVG